MIESSCGTYNDNLMNVLNDDQYYDYLLSIKLIRTDFNERNIPIMSARLSIWDSRTRTILIINSLVWVTNL